MACAWEESTKIRDVLIRPGTENDCNTIMDLIRELASFQGYPYAPQITAEILRRDGFGDNQQASFQTLLAVDRTTDKIIGYAVFFPFYSTWRGKGMFLEDLYVKPAHRKLGIGKLLLAHVSKRTLDSGGCQLRLSVLKTNPAKMFYSSLGFDNLTVDDGWETGRLDTNALEHLLESSGLTRS
ncbi:hypothetical protein RvY_09926 [Ramazzottius varieornatus]|uniref:N-acetyltransferase domain-containing protein n=1 Tax=Ramazzottius varieornatus TaxID=947166 RepID=A0A1D1VB19_RAMVA|nr:hypothetical protein RvY_09926 [Ramazzottius varieornatus]